MGVHRAHIFCSRSFLGDSAPYTERQLWAFYSEYGGTPRALADYALDSTDYEIKLAKQIQAMNPTVMWDVLNSPYFDDRFDLVVVVEPTDDSRAARSKSFASRPVFQKLWDRHFEDNPSEALRYVKFFQRGTD